MIAQYLETQDAEPQDDNFMVSIACRPSRIFRRLQSPADSTAFRRCRPSR